MRTIADHSARFMRQSGAHQPVSIAITSGKGGVGKTNVVGNLAVSLANLKKRVLVLDADFGLANVDVLFGLTPKYNLRDVLYGDMGLEDIIVEGPAGVRVIPASSGVEQMAALTLDQQTRLMRGLMELGAETDYLLIDTAAGISANVVNFLLASGLVIVVTNPEPTSIVDAYLVIKILALREPGKRVALLVNSVSGFDEAQSVFQQIDSASRRFLDKPLELLGFIERDKNVLEAVRRQIPVASLYPRSAASQSIKAIASKLDRQCSAMKRPENSGLAWHELFAASV
ncbi:MAG TPA: MinD/ParA family protein [Terriglobia bacterium]|nr:MinD/ParA family protein [Terriglobia bacterium]